MSESKRERRPSGRKRKRMEKPRRMWRRFVQKERLAKVKVVVETVTPIASLGLAIWAARHGG